jgi:hypothetical protein
MKKCTKCGLEKSLDQFWFNEKKGVHVAACRDCAAEGRKSWKLRNLDKSKETNRAWQEQNRDKTKAAQDRYRENNPGLAAERTAKWRAENRDWALESQRQSDRKLKDAAYAAYGGYRCNCCGETIEAFLSIDHVNNDGAEHRKTMNRRKIYKWLKENNYPEGFQILCMNCNFGKARNGGICPHETLRSEGSSTIPKGSTAKWPEARGSSTEDEDIVRPAQRCAAVSKETVSE